MHTLVLKFHKYISFLTKWDSLDLKMTYETPSIDLLFLLDHDIITGVVETTVNFI